MPHLNEVFKKYQGRVNVTGVNVWEDRQAKDNSFHSKVADYIKMMGDKMTYNVAADGFDGKVTKAWVEPAEIPGIPTAFIVGKDGTILWMGHPMVGMDEAIEQILADKYDLAAAAKKDAERRAAAKAERELMAPIQEALRANDVSKAVGLIDAAMIKNPEQAKGLGMTKFNLLLRSDEPKAYAWASEFAIGAGKGDVNVLNALAWTIVDDSSKLKKPDNGLAVKIAERGVSILKENDPFAPWMMDTLAYALYKNGDLDRALATQTRAVAIAESMKEFPEATMKEMKDRLAMLKLKKGNA